MRKKKPIEFNIGDLIESKRNPTKGQLYLVIDKVAYSIEQTVITFAPEYLGSIDLFGYKYTVLNLLTSQYETLNKKCNTQYWKIVS